MKYLITILLIAECCFCHAQINTDKQLHFNFIGVKDGLPEGTVKVLLQDKYGYIWIGTQTGIVRFDGYNVKVYKTATKDSIPVYSAALYEDRRGRLWLGTIDDGIYLYDRSADSFINYVAPFQKNEPDNIFTVFAFQDDAAGNLWIKMYNALTTINLLAYFNTTTKQYKLYSRQETGNHFINATSFTDFLEDKNGTLWMGSNNGIYNYDAQHDQFKSHFSATDTAKQISYVHLLQDKQHPGFIYCGSWYTQHAKDDIGLFRFNISTGEHRFFVHDAGNNNSLAANEIRKIIQPGKYELLVATAQGISAFNTVTQAFTNYVPDAKNTDPEYNLIKDIKPDKKGGYWCETGTGILYFNNNTKQFTRYTSSIRSDNGIAGRYIHNLILDNSGNIWFGVEQLGLQWLNVSKSKFIFYRDNPNVTDYFPGGTANSIAQTKDGTFWIGCNKGLYHWQPNSKVFTLIENKQFKNASVVAVTADKEGLIWFRAFGGNTQGVYAYNPATQQTKNYRHSDKDSKSLANDNVQHIAEDSSGNIWLGSAGSGISRINKATRQITNYPYIINNGLNTDIAIKNGWLDDNEVQTIYVDKTGTVFVGTNNGSFNIYNFATGKFAPVNKNLFKGLYCVVSLYNDSKNRLWAGTYMTGIYYRQNKNYKKISNADNLLYNGSWGMAEDGSNKLWSTSPRGLTIIDSAGNMRNITAANGLPQEPDYFVLFKAINGNFFYCCKNGFIQFNPADFSPDTTKPVLHIENISFSTPSLEDDSTIITFDTHAIQLHYNENRITFNYNGLQYQNPASVKYAYKLDGYDDDWINAGTDRNVTYTNLSPGTYTFRVKAANSDGVWTKKDATITITITPPWWQTWWAYVLYAVIIIGLISAYVAYRSARLKKENKLLEDKVNQRTGQLNKSLLNLKATQAQLIQSEKMASLGELTAGIAHEIQNPLNFVNNFSEVNSELIDEMNVENNIEEIKAIANDIKQNNEKITFHGKRADAIVKGMLQHSWQTKGIKEPTDINALCDEYLKLAYYGLRTKDKAFNADFKTDFDESIDKINIVPQDIGRMLLNLFNNAFYAVNKKKKSFELSAFNYDPLVLIQTKKIKNKIEIRIEDNGNGIPANIIDKIFQPFFTTKPTGQGTGLGLSLAYDIITKEHGGTIKVTSEEGEGSEFIIELPF